MFRLVKHYFKFTVKTGGGGTTRPLSRDGGAEELRGDPTVGHTPRSGP